MLLLRKFHKIFKRFHEFLVENFTQFLSNFRAILKKISRNFEKIFRKFSWILRKNFTQFLGNFTQFLRKFHTDFRRISHNFEVILMYFLKGSHAIFKRIWHNFLEKFYATFEKIQIFFTFIHGWFRIGLCYSFFFLPFSVGADRQPLIFVCLLEVTYLAFYEVNVYLWYKHTFFNFYESELVQHENYIFTMNFPYLGEPVLKGD